MPFFPDSELTPSKLCVEPSISDYDDDDVEVDDEDGNDDDDDDDGDGDDDVIVEN